MAGEIKALIEVFGELEDVRKARGKRYGLAALLCMACVAMLCGYKSYGAIAQWGHDYGTEWAKRLGFKEGRTPCVATWHNVFKTLKVEQFEAKNPGYGFLSGGVGGKRAYGLSQPRWDGGGDSAGWQDIEGECPARS